MKCPACSKEMIGEDFGGVKVDVCMHGCKGMWFDWFELTKLDEKHEGCGKALKQALQSSRRNDESRGQISCPKCNILMYIHKYQSSKEVNVDECYQCGGFFLDAGELKSVRDSFMNEGEREKYAQKIIDEVPEMTRAQKNLEKEKLRAEAAKKYTKFVRLSYYMTGK